MKFDEGGTIFANKFQEIGSSYYLDPANTDVSIKVAGKIQTCGRIEAEEIEVKNVCAANIKVNIENVADYVLQKTITYVR
ncbi:MAG: hypothetical protein HC896_15680 [Bacteroidales bacterium]|nr:hypothetical protein [Bacteroidales bacterium]